MPIIANLFLPNGNAVWTVIAAGRVVHGRDHEPAVPVHNCLPGQFKSTPIIIN
jgi:hypothetical protein